MTSKITCLFLLLIFSSPTFAYEIFFYNNPADMQDNIAKANRNQYDGYDAQDFVDFDDYACISLDDYNYYANLDSHDNRDPLTAKNIGNKKFKKLGYQDQLLIINENHNDKWDNHAINDYNDMECWTLKDYNQFAAEKQSDKWDVANFRDFDDFEIVEHVGVKRYGFIEPDDLDEFDLHYTHPSAREYYDNYYNGYSFNFYENKAPKKSCDYDYNGCAREPPIFIQ
ncbi:hypothetical protein COV18_03510 [Candidatus Woesearchaeota archaeon CG10_big_fil_rev_8_21_14_0_10_37_12]|nr:MAG: hypothetical protein COV18_03510 [Candidatus Woesearchaeota archaeon CG10_big_fil_rev_8_21_14_0_10_37_12]